MASYGLAAALVGLLSLTPIEGLERRAQAESAALRLTPREPEPPAARAQRDPLALLVRPRVERESPFRVEPVMVDENPWLDPRSVWSDLRTGAVSLDPWRLEDPWAARWPSVYSPRWQGGCYERGQARCRLAKLEIRRRER